MPQITIAAIHGHCVGGGVVLAAACDLRIASDDARISIPEVDSASHSPGVASHGWCAKSARLRPKNWCSLVHRSIPTKLSDRCGNT
ncbi:MAG: enoyl-CoA hydratase/isomerase family protein [Ilumatobacteraceae bacterium]